MAKTLTVYLAADVGKLTRGLNDASRGVDSFGDRLGNMLGPALIGAGIAAGAFAAKLAGDSVEAALADEKAMKSLEIALQNVGAAHNVDSVEKFIDALARESGVADDKLRPAFQKLVTATGDVARSQNALQLAMDISAGTGRDLESVSLALAKGFGGTTTALGKLGAGIDANIIASKDMGAITDALSQKFKGQAAAAAETYQGRIDRVTVAADEAKEVIGRALLDAVDNVSDAFGGVGGMQEQITKTGDKIANIISGLGVLVSKLDNLQQATEPDTAPTFFDIFIREMQNLSRVMPASTGQIMAVGDQLEIMALQADQAAYEASGFNDVMTKGRLQAMGYGDGVRYAAGQVDDLGDAVESTYRDFIKFAQISAQSTKTTADQAERAQGAAERMADLSGAVDDYSRSSGSANSAADTTNKLLEGQQTLVGGLTTKLKAQTAELDNATAAVTTYVDSLAKQITQGFDLGTGFEMKDGAVDAAQWIAGVNSEVDKLTWYGNVLKRIKEEGGQGLADYLAAQGVEQGALYGQALIDTGLITTMADKLSTVQTQANLVAQAMVPEFLLAGQDSAEEFVNGTITQIALEEKRLRKIGQAIGQPIGANIKAEIAQAVAEAIRAAEAAGTAARAEVSARETARQVQLTEQATAQSLARLIRQSDQRAGVGVRPVLT